MARTLSAALTTEMNSLARTPAARVTVERWQPEWTARLSGLSAGELERYAHGHAAAVYPDGNGAGEDILLRARSGSYANPQDGRHQSGNSFVKSARKTHFEGEVNDRIYACVNEKEQKPYHSDGDDVFISKCFKCIPLKFLFDRAFPFSNTEYKRNWNKRCESKRPEYPWPACKLCQQAYQRGGDNQS